MIIGEIIVKDREIILNEGRETIELCVTSKSDRPIQIGSHFHFFEVNKALSFDRKKAFGMHLNIPSGTSVRFEPGESKTVQLVQMGGTKEVYGLNNLTNGKLNNDTLEKAMQKLEEEKFLNEV